MKKFLIFLFSFLVGIGLFIWVIEFVGWQEIKNAFLVFTGWQGLVILSLTALMLIFGAWRWREILKSQGHNISLTALWGPYLSWFSLSYLIPMLFWGTDVFRGYVLKEKFSVPWIKGMASVIIDRILELTIYLIVFFIGMIFLFLAIGLPPKEIGLILVGIFIFFSAGIGFFYFKVFKKESIIKFFVKLFNNKKFLDGKPLKIEEEIFKFFKPKESFFWKAIGFAFLKATAGLVRVWLLLFFLGETIKLSSALSVLGFSYFTMLIPVPAAIGSHEVVQVFVFSALELGGGIATAFTMIIRGADLILALVGIVILFKLGFGLLQANLFKKIEKLMNNKYVN